MRTVRRRWVAATVLGVALTGLGAGVAASTSQAAAPAEQAEPVVAVVQPGDTLWSVVARHAPGRDPYGMIEEVRERNDLPDHTIHPGQELILPGGG